MVDQERPRRAWTRSECLVGAFDPQESADNRRCEILLGERKHLERFSVVTTGCVLWNVGCSGEG